MPQNNLDRNGGRQYMTQSHGLAQQSQPALPGSSQHTNKVLTEHNQTSHQPSLTQGECEGSNAADSGCRWKVYSEYSWYLFTLFMIVRHAVVKYLTIHLFTDTFSCRPIDKCIVYQMNLLHHSTWNLSFVYQAHWWTVKVFIKKWTQTGHQGAAVIANPAISEPACKWYSSKKVSDLKTHHSSKFFGPWYKTLK